MHQDAKSQLLPLLEGLLSGITETEHTADAIILHGAAIMNGLLPSSGSIFESYAGDEVLTKVQKSANGPMQIHVVFDI